MTVIIGKDESGKNVEIIVPVLVDTRLLIQAGSGGGKSYTIRKIVEEIYGTTQIFILDLEGEFGTVREKYDFMLFGKNGDLPTNPRTAGLLARKLLELNANAIIDLYELKKHERIAYVKDFLESMINAPKSLWHPCIVILDEAHVLCPEKGNSEAASAVIDLCTRGRKRGYCAVLATQRLSKLNKDAAAECNNKLIGRTGLDIDQRRAGDELGFTRKEQLLSLRDLEPGQFFVFGPAISKSVIKMKVGKVSTTHPKAGSRQLMEVVPPAKDKIKALLSKLTDLPQEAQKELHEKSEMKTRIRELETTLRVEKRHPVKIDEGAIERAREISYNKGVRETATESLRTISVWKNSYIKADATLSKIAVLVGGKREVPKIPVPERKEIPHTPQVERQTVPLRKWVKPVQTQVYKVGGEGTVTLGICEKKILSLLYNNPEKEFDKSIAAVFTRYSHKSGGFNNSISRLVANGLIQRNNSKLKVSERGIDEGVELLGNEINLFETFKLENWKNILGKCEGAIFTVLLDEPYREFSKDELADITNYSANSGGFNNAISRLNSLALIKRFDGKLKLNEEILEM